MIHIFSVYPTNNDGRIRAEDALPLQQTTFVKPETVRASHNICTPPVTPTHVCYSYSNPAKAMGGYPGHPGQ